MIEPGFRDTLPPAMDGGGGGLNQLGDLRSAAEHIDDVSSVCVHAMRNAIIATSSQQKSCDTRNCDNRRNSLVGGMDLDELKRKMRAKGLKQVDIANATGLEPDKVSKSFAGTRRFTAAELDIIRALVDADRTQTIPGVRPARSIPLIGSVVAGKWKEAIQQPMGNLPVSDDVPPNAVALCVDGDSMDRFVNDGASIIFDPDDRSLFPGRLYVILNGQGEATFKQFMTDPARLVPCSTNPAHKEIPINGEESFTIVGRVISGVVRF